MILPDLFLQNMQTIFSYNNMTAEYEAFLEALSEKEWKRAWRLNTNKMDPLRAVNILLDSSDSTDMHPSDFLQSVPWSEDGFYIPSGERPALSMLYHLGVIYIQEASAMLPAEVLQAVPGEKILDLCAAPGGKSSQTAARLNGQGFLIANDISEPRARVLQRNLEQQGLQNTYVISADPAEDIPDSWFGTFDGIQLDAPCSGEGMFRRDASAVDSWSAYGPTSIRPVQERLMDIAAKLVRPGGRIVYSTCTFNTYENEELISSFLETHKGFRVSEVRENIRNAKGIRRGLQGPGILPELKEACRIWPQDDTGEGHFCVLLVRDRDLGQGSEPVSCADSNSNSVEGWVTRESNSFQALQGQGKCAKEKKNKKSSKSNATENGLFPSFADGSEALRSFVEENVNTGAWDFLLQKTLRVFRNWMYFVNDQVPDMRNVKVLKSGCFLGELKKAGNAYKLSVSHTFLLEMPASIWRHTVRLNKEDDRIRSLLRGQTLTLSAEERSMLENVKDGSFVAILWEDYPLSWTKKQGSTLKNLYPANWVR